MIVYRSMDQQTLDAAYNNSVAVVHSDHYLADWLRRREALRARMPDHLNLVYGDAPRTRLDFFATKRPGAPTLLFFHGGYWQRNTKEGFSFVGEGPLAHGFHVAVAGYTLAPAATMDGIVREARTALHWLHQNVATLGGDPARLYVAGWSAGGHLTAMLMDEPHLPARAAKLIIAYGSDELPELKRQSNEFAAAWSGRGLPGEIIEVAGCHRYAVLEQLAQPDGLLAKALAAVAAD